MTNPTFETASKRPTESHMSPFQGTQRTRLENRLTVVTTPLTHLHTVAVSIFVPGGPRHESRSDNGLSHLVEHALFRGCEGYHSAREFNEAIETCSLGLGAATYREFVTFDATCRPDALETLLDLVGAMLKAPTWRDLHIEQRIIVEELQDERDEQGRDIDVDNVAKMTLMPGCGAGRKIGGEISRVKQFRAEDCQRWFERHYGAENMTLSVAGPVTHARVVEAATRAMRSLPTGQAVETPPATIRADLPALEYVSHGGNQTSLQMAWVLPAPTSDDWAGLVAAQRLFDDGSSARLRRRITDDDGLAYHVGTSLEAFTYRALFVVEAELSHGNVLPVIDAVLDEIEGLATQPATEREWARVRDRYSLDIDAAVDVAPEVAYRAGLSTFYDRPADIDELRDRFMALSPQGIADIAARHLRANALQITVVGELDPVDRAGLRRRIHRLRPPAET